MKLHVRRTSMPERTYCGLEADGHSAVSERQIVASGGLPVGVCRRCETLLRSSVNSDRHWYRMSGYVRDPRPLEAIEAALAKEGRYGG